MNKRSFIIKQKLLGILILILTVICTYFMYDEITGRYDCTVPLGLWMIFSKDIIIYIGKENEEEGDS